MTTPTDLATQLDNPPTNDVVADVAEMGRNSLYFFAKHILGYDKLTDDCHGLVCNWYQQNQKRFKLLMYPRGHFKTTVHTISAGLWRVVRDPNRTGLLVNESGLNSSRFLQTIKSHAENNARFRTFYGHLIPRNTKQAGHWNNDELLFIRQRHCPEPTISSIGLDGTTTSQHFNHITFDDIISEKAANSPAVMHSAIENMKVIQPLLVDRDHDTIDWVGTHWSFNDAYTWLKGTYGDMLAKLVLPVIDAEGKLLAPNIMSMEQLALERRTMGPYLFSCLMLNNPRDEANQDLNVKDLRYWEWASGNPDSKVVVLYDPITGAELDRWHIAQLDITTTVDLAPSESRDSDRNAITTVGISPKAQAIVLDSWASREKAYHVLDYLFQINKRFAPRLFGIENVAYQAAFKHFVEQRMLDTGEWLRVVPIKPPGGNKSHVRGLQPIMAVGRLYVNAQQHILINEMSEFPLGAHDDAVDSLALQLQVWKGVLGPAQRESAAKAVSELVSEQQRSLQPSGWRRGGKFSGPPPTNARDPEDDPEWLPGRFTTDRTYLGI